MIFRVWDADETDFDGRDVTALDEEDAASSFAERRWARCDYPKEQSVCVRAPNGIITKWTVEAEQTVEFRAREAK